MTDCRNTPQSPKNRRRALWGIITLFTVAGICAGVAAGITFTYVRALQEVNGIRANYSQSARERARLLDLCIQTAPKAATQAALAADRAAEAANRAAGQAESDEQRIEGEIPQTKTGEENGQAKTGR
jgi:hypothetical protein